MGNIGIPGGPFQNFKYGGLTLHPKEDSSPEIDFGGRNFELKLTGDKETYSEASGVPAMITTDIVMNADDFKKLNRMKDGKPRAGTATNANGDVYTLNMAINGELKHVNGIVSLNLAGTLRQQ